MTMVFRISTDIVESAEDRCAPLHDTCIDILNQLGRAYRRGFHLLYAEKKLLRRIEDLADIDRSAKEVYTHIISKYDWLKKVVDAIGFHALITTAQTSSKDKSCILINPKEFPNFFYERHINLICENIRDADFYKIVTVVIAKRKSLSDRVKITYNNDAGNGANTVQKVETRYQESDNLFLSILDSDRHFGDENRDTVPKGDTAQSVENYFGRADVNIVLGDFYILKGVSEIENLLPIAAVKKLNHTLGDAKSLSQDALCWYDMKKGVSCKHVRNGERCRKYWLKVYEGNPGVTKRINEAAGCTSQCKGCKSPMKISTAFGGSLLENLLKKEECKSLLFNTKMEFLTHAQRCEWENVGNLLIQWCCAPPKTRV